MRLIRYLIQNVPMQTNLNSGEAVGGSGALMKNGPALLSTSKQFTAFFQRFAVYRHKSVLNLSEGAV